MSKSPARKQTPNTDALDSEYENAVADVLGFLLTGSAVVTRNEKLYGRRSKTWRQFDVVARSRSLGAEMLLVVDCKRWSKPLDVTDADKFIGMVQDVGADQGLLVSTLGASDAALATLVEARGIRLDVMSLNELEGWAPRGTVSIEYRIPIAKQAAASRKLRRAGFRVVPSRDHPATSSEVTICLLRHYGPLSPPFEVQAKGSAQALAALKKAGVLEPVCVGGGVVAGGGTPAHRWLDVGLQGQPIGWKILAATDAEAEEEMLTIRQYYERAGLPTDELTYLPPPGWPAEGLFGGWPHV